MSAEFLAERLPLFAYSLFNADIGIYPPNNR